jgi:hypothetical protein
MCFLGLVVCLLLKCRFPACVGNVFWGGTLWANNLTVEDLDVAGDALHVVHALAATGG